MLPHLDVRIARESDIHEARAVAVRVASLHGIDDGASGRVALVVTELATNLLRHARDGRLLIGCHAVDDGGQIEVIAIDSGPGMADVNRYLRQHSSGRSPGGGLAGVRQASTDFSIYSLPGKGTVMLSRAWSPAKHAPLALSPSARFAHSGICLAKPGEDISGDAWDIRITESRATVIVADGSGVGVVAAGASSVATSAFRETSEAPGRRIEKAHALLRPTVGAAVAIADLDARAGTITFSGVGSVAGRLVTAAGDTRLPTQGGMAGATLADVRENRLRWPDHSVVVLHSDGLRDDWDLRDAPGLLQCDPAVIGGWLIRDHVIDSDDVTVVVLKRG
jgi:anti-sigma regulatory factor (Ser/Thr protein kinase)